MKYLLLFVTCLLLAFQTLSQTTLKEPRVKTIINSNGDTLIEMSLADAKTVLENVLQKEVSDSMLLVYTTRDSLSSNKVMLLEKKISRLEMKEINLSLINWDNTKILGNKDKEIADLNDTIKKQKKEIRKQKILKLLGFTGSVVLPITTFILLTR